MDCTPFVKRRDACYSKHGMSSSVDDWHIKRSSKSGQSSERCLIPTLQAKRCLAFQKCEMEALHYYGTPHDSIGPKALCASFEEGFCFGNPRIMKVDGERGASNDREKIFAHHQKAKRRVVNNRQKFKACQDISDRLHRCLNKAVAEEASS